MDDHEYAAALRRTMEDLPRTFVRPVPIDDLLTGVTAAAVDLIDGADCADVLAIWESDDFRSLAATRQLAIDVDITFRNSVVRVRAWTQQPVMPWCAAMTYATIRGGRGSRTERSRPGCTR